MSTRTLGLLGYRYVCPYGSPTCRCARDVFWLIVLPALAWPKPRAASLHNWCITTA